jgi:hypothetical protein
MQIVERETNLFSCLLVDFVLLTGGVHIPLKFLQGINMCDSLLAEGVGLMLPPQGMCGSRLLQQSAALNQTRNSIGHTLLQVSATCRLAIRGTAIARHQSLFSKRHTNCKTKRNQWLMQKQLIPECPMESFTCSDVILLKKTGCKDIEKNFGWDRLYGGEQIQATY